MVTKANPTELFDVELKGLSTDDKPTDVAVNSLFLELDTGKFYYFDGEAWNELGTGGGGGDGVLFEGTLVFTENDGEITCPEFDMLLPEDGDPAAFYIDGDLDVFGVWSYVEIPGPPYYEFIVDESSERWPNIYIAGYPLKGHIQLHVDSGYTPGSKLIKLGKPAE